MKITPKILSIPPYLSTTWKNISSLLVRQEGNLFRLIVILQNRVQVEVPGLDKETVDSVFEAHAKYAEIENTLPSLESPMSFTLPIQGVKEDGTVDLLNSAIQHNPEQASLPPIPQDILKKITTVAKAFGLEDLSVIPNAEPNCNCMYCQVVRSLHGDSPSTPAIEDAVTEEDLRFQDWDIKETDEKLYKVTNRLDKNEHYNVFLGEPLGCTCGKTNCEHIRAVLST